MSRLAVTWSGPSRVTGFRTPLVSLTENLIGEKIREVHVSRLNVYDNGFLSADEDLKDCFKYQKASLYLLDELKAIKRTRRPFGVPVPLVDFPG